MKRGLWLIVLLALLLPVCLAGATEDLPATAPALATPTPTRDYLIGLPPPREPLELDPTLRNAAPSRLLNAAAEQQAAPLLAELAGLRHDGQILDFTLDPARFAVRVRVAGEMPLLTAAGTYLIDAAAEPPSCVAGLPAAVTEMARAATEPAAPPPAGRAATDAPTIHVRVNPPYVGRYSFVYGYAAPDSDIEMRVYRNGSLYLEWFNDTDSDGYYNMYPYYESCPRSGYVWYLQPGDVVEMTAGGETSRTTVVPVLASLDPRPGAAELTGVTAPNRALWASVLTEDNDSCDIEWVDFNDTSQADGRFTIDVSSVDNLNGRAYSVIYAFDEDGNSSYTYVEAFHISSETGYNGVWATVNRNAVGTATLSRNGQQIAHQSFVSDTVGYASVYFDSVTIMPGDVITVDDGQMTMTMARSSIEVYLNADDNRLDGITDPGRTVRVYSYTRNDSGGAVQTGCNWDSDCGVVANTTNQGFQIPIAFDVRPGDYAYVEQHDATGHTEFYPTVSAKTLVAGPGLNIVRGYWLRSNVDITVRLYDAGNNLKAESLDFTSYDGEIWSWLSEPVAVGDRVEVSDFNDTRTMVVPLSSGRLNSAADVLSLAGSDGPFLATFTDYDGYYYNGYECYEGAMAGGQHTIDLDGRVTPGDYAHAYLAGADGNYTLLDLAAFQVSVLQGGNQVFVRTELPNSEVRLLHDRNGVPVYLATLTAQPPGYVYFNSADTFEAGDHIEIDAFGEEDTSGTSMTLTPLTAVADPAHNAVTGTAPANAQAVVRVVRHAAYGWRWSHGEVVDVDQNGTYNVPFYEGWYWGGNLWMPCLPTRVDDRCVVPTIEYMTSKDHIVELAIDAPPPAPADAFENDDTAATAKPHTGGTRTHTFHTPGDVDWVKVTIPAWAVGRPVTFRAFNMGWDVAVDMVLLRADGTTPVPNQGLTFADPEISLTWTPDAAGTVLLRVMPQDEEATGHCDSFYDLRIDMAQLFLPGVLR